MDEIMQRALAALENTAQGAPMAALFVAMLWGILSVVLSPCHLTVMPVVVSLVSRKGGVHMKEAFKAASWFSIGLLVPFGLAIGLAMAVRFTLVQNIGIAGAVLTGGLFFVTAWVFWGDRGLRPWRRFFAPENGEGRLPGSGGSFMLGMIFGSPMGPCAVAFFIPLLLAASKMAPAHPIYAGAMVVLFVAFHWGLLAVVGMAANGLIRWVPWHRKPSGWTLYRRAMAILLAITGIHVMVVAGRNLAKYLAS